MTILNMAGDEEVWVLEMGMTEPGDIRRLLEMWFPMWRCLTKIALAMWRLSGGLAEIAKRKSGDFHPSKDEKGDL